LLHLGEIVAATVSSVEQEAARDLVRARDDVRGDLMSARHRLSKLLLRQGIVYRGGKAWTASHGWAPNANRRLHERWIAFDARHKRPVVANTAIARELAGWCWSLAVLDS
jgi:hypothetical protein